MKRFDERNAHLQRQSRPQRGLAGSAQPDECDAPPADLFSWTEIAHQAEDHVFKAVIGEAFEESLDHLFVGRLFHLWGEQLHQRNLESGGNPAQQHDRDVPFACL
jgi:hypothetical protein